MECPTISIEKLEQNHLDGLMESIKRHLELKKRTNVITYKDIEHKIQNEDIRIAA